MEKMGECMKRNGGKTGQCEDSTELSKPEDENQIVVPYVTIPHLSLHPSTHLSTIHPSFQQTWLIQFGMRHSTSRNPVSSLRFSTHHPALPCGQPMTVVTRQLHGHLSCAMEAISRCDVDVSHVSNGRETALRLPVTQRQINVLNVESTPRHTTLHSAKHNTILCDSMKYNAIKYNTINMNTTRCTTMDCFMWFPFIQFNSVY